MAKQHEIKKVAEMMTDLSNQVNLCNEIASTLIEVGQSWHSQWLENPTDYEQIRKQVMKMAKKTHRNIHCFRKVTLNPDLIRAEAYVSKFIDYCRRCPNVNRKRVANTEPFICLLKNQFDDKTQSLFRFQINRKGKIVEHR